MEGRFINRRQRSKHLVAIATKEVVKRDQFVIWNLLYTKWRNRGRREI